MSYVRRKLLPGAKIRMWRIRKLVERDGGECYICHQPFEKAGDMTIDHLIPSSKGGSEELSNLRLAHFKCNQAKGDMTLAEFIAFQERW